MAEGPPSLIGGHRARPAWGQTRPPREGPPRASAEAVGRPGPTSQPRGQWLHPSTASSSSGLGTPTLGRLGGERNTL